MARKRTRVNLHVYVTENGQPLYHVLHVGFFSPAVAAAVAVDMDAAGLAFHSDARGQSGKVDVVLADSKPGVLESFQDGRCVRQVSYAPREA